jgi:hypothetical protein
MDPYAIPLDLQGAVPLEVHISQGDFRYILSYDSLRSRAVGVSRSWWSNSEITVKVNDTVRSFRIQQLEIN